MVTDPVLVIKAHAASVDSSSARGVRLQPGKSSNSICYQRECALERTITRPTVDGNPSVWFVISAKVCQFITLLVTLLNLAYRLVFFLTNCERIFLLISFMCVITFRYCSR